MIKGAIFELEKSQAKFTSLGWDRIRIVDIRESATVSYDVAPTGWISEDASKNTAKKIRKELDIIAICDESAITILSETDFYEDIMMFYKLANAEVL